MATPTFLPVSGVVDVTEVVSAAAQTEINAAIDLVIALIPNVDLKDPASSSFDDSAVAPSGAAPLYDKIAPEYASALRVELEALKTAIDAAPTS